jgi:hypothetical protein
MLNVPEMMGAIPGRSVKPDGDSRDCITYISFMAGARELCRELQPHVLNSGCDCDSSVYNSN